LPVPRFKPLLSLLVLFCGSSFLPAGAQAPAGGLETTVFGFLAKNCRGYHNAKLSSGQLNLEPYTTEASILQDRERWERLIRKLRTGEMPPPGMPRPDPEATSAAAAAIEAVFDEADRRARPDPGRVTAGRLNRTEYSNTVRDLLGVDFAPADDFLPDDSGYGLDSIGDVLPMSHLLMEKYLAAAEKIARRAVYGMEELKSSPVTHQPWYIDFDLGKEVKFDYDLTGRSLPSSLQVTHRFPVDAEYVITGELRGFRSAQTSRLSYFLWFIMPDEALLRAADQGTLRRPRDLEEQVRRMLQDPRSRSGLREKNGSLLDQSMIVYGCGIADSDRHTHTGLPLVLVGGGGTFRGGRHIDLGKDTPLANLTSCWRNARECSAALSVTAPESWISKCISLS
jgi:hypothetical protein